MTWPVLATVPAMPVPTFRRIGLTEPPSRIWLTSSSEPGSRRKIVPRSASVSEIAVFRMMRSVSVGSNVSASDLFASRITISLTMRARVTETSASTRSRTCPSKAEMASDSAVASAKRASGSLAIERSRMSRSSGGRSGRSVSTLGAASVMTRRTSRAVSSSSNGTRPVNISKRRTPIA